MAAECFHLTRSRSLAQIQMYAKSALKPEIPGFISECAWGAEKSVVVIRRRTGMQPNIFTRASTR